MRHRGYDPLLGAVLVVALVAAAALALQGRQGLDWGALAEPVEVGWARVVGGAVVLLVLIAMARTLLRRVLRPRRPVQSSGRAEPEGQPIPLLLRVLAVVLIVAITALSWWILTQFLAPVGVGEQGTDQPLDPGPGAGGPPSVSWPVLIGVAAVLLVAAAVTRLVGRSSDPGLAGSDRDSEDADSQELAAAVTAAEEHLAHHADARAAIVAAYQAMATRITAGLARRGGTPRASDTPTELLGRAVAAGLVGTGPAGDLTALFREARFSRHPMGPAQRAAAETALSAVRDELEARRPTTAEDAHRG